MLYISNFKRCVRPTRGQSGSKSVPTARSLCGCKSSRSSEIVVNDAVASYFGDAVCPTRGDSAAVPVTSFSAAALKSFDQMRMLSVSVCAGGGRSWGDHKESRDGVQLPRQCRVKDCCRFLLASFSFLAFNVSAPVFFFANEHDDVLVKRSGGSMPLCSMPLCPPAALA